MSLIVCHKKRALKASESIRVTSLFSNYFYIGLIALCSFGRDLNAPKSCNSAISFCTYYSARLLTNDDLSPVFIESLTTEKNWFWGEPKPIFPKSHYEKSFGNNNNMHVSELSSIMQIRKTEAEQATTKSLCHLLVFLALRWKNWHRPQVESL